MPLSRFAALALECVHREYPNHLSHRMEGDADARPPRELTPAFYGCFDWHSAVHGHWLLARVARVEAGSEVADKGLAVLAQSLTADKLAAETRYVAARPGFERPYGLAWLLELDHELCRGGDRGEHRAALAPLVAVAVSHLASWLPKLARPNRSGVHSQTAFALGLVHDWAVGTGDLRVRDLVRERALALYGSDHGYAVHLEPCGEDFLSPSLGAVDLMSRLLAPDELAGFLDRVLPGLDERTFEPLEPADRSDGRLCHLDGLSLSRAWMLERIASRLPIADARRPALAAAAGRHREAGLAAVSSDHYEGAHWLGTFAVYLLTRAASE